MVDSPSTYWIVLLALAGGLLFVLARVVAEGYRRAMTVERARIDADRLVAQTPYGPVEYGLAGDGSPVLVLHGGGGGYDQGLLLGRALQRCGFQIIAPSRPGYLGTPLNVGATPVQQADAFVALLDSLSIKRVAVMGASAGGPVALHFALRHAERCTALIMLSAISRARALNPWMQLSSRWFAGSGILVWLSIMLSERQVILTMGPVKPEVLHKPEKMAVLRTILMQSARGKLIQDGLVNDLTQNENLPDLPLHQITLPTLVLHGTADPLVSCRIGEYTAATIPGARFEAVEQGGHLSIFTHEEQVVPMIASFLQQNTP